MGRKMVKQAIAENNPEGSIVIQANDDGSIKEHIMPHAVRMMPSAEWKNTTGRMGHGTGSPSTSVFGLEDAGYIVGSEALTSGELERKFGPSKYKKGYLDILVIAQLLQMFPDGHDNLVLSVAHNMESSPYKQQIKDAVNGIHNVTRPDGKKVRFVVRGSTTWDEPAGAIFRWMSGNGSYNEGDLEVGDIVLVIDLGGRIGSIVPTEILAGNRVNPHWGNAEELDFGIQDITEALERELRSNYTDTFDFSGQIPDKIKNTALRTGGITYIRNKEIDVTLAVNNALAPFLRRFRIKYEGKKIQSGANAQGICLSGGGGGLLYVTFQEKVFGDLAPYAHLADNAATIQFANLRGGEFMTSNWFELNDAKIPKGKAEKERVVVILDPGNSLLKGKTLWAGYNAA